MRLKNKLQTPAPAGKKPKARFSPAKAAYYVFLSFMMFLMTTQPVYALDVWTKATEIQRLCTGAEIKRTDSREREKSPLSCRLLLTSGITGCILTM